MEKITAEALIERRALINAVDAASAEKAAYLAAEAKLAAFYLRWPLKAYRKEFTAETKRNRGW